MKESIKISEETIIALLIAIVILSFIGIVAFTINKGNRQETVQACFAACNQREIFLSTQDQNAKNLCIDGCTLFAKEH
jgi:type II secretory pathway pseudopilin PulG